MRHSLCLSIGPLMCFGCFVIAWWGCAAPIAPVGNPAFDGIYEDTPIADPANRAHQCPLVSREVVSVRNGEATLTTSNDTKMGVVHADGTLVMTDAHGIKIPGWYGHVEGTLTHNALDAVVFYPAWTSMGGGGP